MNEPAQDKTFHRQDLARRIAALVLTDDLTSAASSGFFLPAPRRTGKTTFIRQDLVPQLESMGAHVVYVDLWKDRARDPAELIAQALRSALADLGPRALKWLTRLGIKGGRVAGVEVSLDQIGIGKSMGLGDALAALGGATDRILVLIIDEAQQANTTRAGADAMFALKAARDELNMKGKGLRVICTGSNQNKLAALTASKDQAFFGASRSDLPPLQRPFIDWICQQARSLPGTLDPEILMARFVEAGHRPEFITGALDDARFDLSLEAGQLMDAVTGYVRARMKAADEATLKVIRSLTPLQSAVFRVLAEQGAGYVPFGESTMALYARYMGEVTSPRPDTPNVQQALQSLQEKGLVWKASRGEYALEEPAVAKLLPKAA